MMVRNLLRHGIILDEYRQGCLRVVQSPRRRAVISIVVLIVIAARSPLPSFAQSEVERVLNTTATFFDALSMPDTVALGKVLLRDGQFYSLRIDSAGATARPSSHEDTFSMLAQNRERFLERGWNPSVSIHGSVAVVSTQYDFYVNGSFSHCGTDVFNLLKTDGGWMISGITYTVERDGCAKSPLGSPYIYQGIRPDLPTGASGIIKSGLVSAYDMETVRDDGRIQDFGPSGNHGEVEFNQNGGWGTGGLFGKSRRFETVEDGIYLPENKSLDLDGPLSIALWIRVRTLGLHQHIIACDDKFALWITPHNNVRLSDSRGHGMDTAQPISANEWFSLVAVFDGTVGDQVTATNPRFYLKGERVDGTLVNRFGDDPPLWNPGALYPSDACHIGFESHQGMESHVTLPLKADIDELMIFSRALSEQEARTHATRE